MIDATPTVTVAGAPVPVGNSPADLLGIEGLSIPWGRAGLLDKTTPARVGLTLLDRSTGATFARRPDLIGQPVVIGWTGSDGTSGTSFRGRITDADLDPTTTVNGAGLRVRAVRVVLAATSIELDAANYSAPEGTVWPAESLAARRARIAGLLPAGLIAGGLTGPDEFGAVGLVSENVGGKSALELAAQLADTQAVPLVYDPTANVLGYAVRRTWASPLPQFTTRLEPVPELGGRYALTASPVAGVWLPARRLAPSGGAGRDIQSRITRVEVTSFDTADGTQGTLSNTLPTVPPESVIGRRALTVETSLAAGGVPGRSAGQCADAWAALVQLEGAAPRIAPATWRSADGWWDTAGQRALMLAGCERSTPLLVQGSWLPEVGMTPLVGIVGGSIGYAAGQWTIALNLAATSHQYPPPGLRGRYAAATAAVRAVDLDPSFTFGDAAWTQMGAGYTATTMPTT